MYPFCVPKLTQSVRERTMLNDMQKLKLKLITNGPNKFKGKLTIQCSKPGTSTRHYMLVPGIESDKLSKWNEDLQCFIGTDKVTLHDNGIIGDVMTRLNELLDVYNFSDGKELFDAFRGVPGKRNKKIPTLGEFLEIVVAEERGKQVGASSNYQLYFTLHNKLKGVNLKKRTTFTPASYNGQRLYDTPISDITDYHFRAFGECVKSDLGGSGYRNLMTTFAATMERAAERYPNIHHLGYKWRKDGVKKVARTERLSAQQLLAASKDDIPTLTVDELNRFLNFDLSTIWPHQKHRQRLVEIYYDTALLMYYTASRPADVIQWDWLHNYCEETRQITYIPHKLRNRGGRRATINLCPQAIAIIEKYRGQSKGGYLLPLPMNETAWGELDGESYKIWESRRSRTLQSINLWLGRIAQALDLDIKKLTMYVFRHSSITHCINRYNMNVMKVAAMAGTSVAIINKHYYNPNIDNDTIPFTDM